MNVYTGLSQGAIPFPNLRGCGCHCSVPACQDGVGGQEITTLTQEEGDEEAEEFP